MIQKLNVIKLETMEEIKKEAKRLIDLFYIHARIEEKSKKSRAKQCALICCDEKIDENNSILEMLKTHGSLRNRITVEGRIYDLQQVKEYIEQNY